MSNELIRPFVAADAVELALPALAGSAYGWTYVKQRPVACCLAFSLPGLPHLAELYQYTAVDWRGQGIGSALLDHACVALQATPFAEVSAQFNSAESPHAQFLLRRGFGVEHIEWEMTLRRPEKVPNIGVRLTQYPREQAIPLFRGLYNTAFEPTAWYQPWLNDDEVLGDWRSGDQILFLEVEDKPIGFVWARRPQSQVAELEPVGIIAAEQGKGFGRKLLTAALNHLARQQVQSVKLGVWATNQPAIKLYRSLGFQKTGSRTYLSRTL
jgi:ribosomal protein S18 acetylase RimI-like enzyme